ncbi:hypothetical protein F5882DRAFT_500924 [Hyaloscypha sp. PMI_1271]|nr:hypothetical protein F5882DRAFT_500924 [Hyaloscypha sp. PMI_1271]
MVSPSQQREKRLKAGNEEALDAGPPASNVEPEPSSLLHTPGAALLPEPGLPRKRTSSGSFKAPDRHAKSGTDFSTTPSNLPGPPSRSSSPPPTVPTMGQFKFGKVDPIFQAELGKNKPRETVETVKQASSSRSAFGHMQSLSDVLNDRFGPKKGVKWGDDFDPVEEDSHTHITSSPTSVDTTSQFQSQRTDAASSATTPRADPPAQEAPVTPSADSTPIAKVEETIAPVASPPEVEDRQDEQVCTALVKYSPPVKDTPASSSPRGADTPLASTSLSAPQAGPASTSVSAPEVGPASPAKKVSKYGGFSLLRWPQESGKSTLMPIEFVPGYNNDRDFYASQIPVVYQKAIAYYEQHQQSSKGFVAAYQQARTAELERHPNDSPWEQQYAIETRLWAKYVGPPHGNFDSFTCPDPKPYLQGYQSGKCDVCARPGHWWWECQESCTNCGSPRHQFPVCAQGLWWLVKKREILEAKSRSKSQPQPQPQLQLRPRPQKAEQHRVEEELEGYIEEVD